MATLRNKRKLAAVWRDTQESARNGQSQNTSVLGMTEEYINQVSEAIEGRVNKDCLRNLLGRIHVFWVLYQNSMKFLSRLAPEPFREHPRITT